MAIMTKKAFSGPNSCAKFRILASVESFMLILLSSLDESSIGRPKSIYNTLSRNNLRKAELVTYINNLKIASYSDYMQFIIETNQFMEGVSEDLIRAFLLARHPPPPTLGP
jgi:hypothetical protein